MSIQPKARAPKSKGKLRSAMRPSPLPRRLGVVGVQMSNEQEDLSNIDPILLEFRSIIISKRLAHARRKDLYILCVVIDASTNDLGAFTGKLGMIPGIKVKSFLL